MQVELAQLRYRLPRLRGRGVQLSQQGAGIGTRGPGETQLEVDRRRILRRITKLERDLDRLARTRGDAAQGAAAPRDPARSRSSVTRTRGSRRCSTGSRSADVLVEDRCSRRSTRRPAASASPAARPCWLSDTVGFVRRLPHQLVEAFRSTLEEVADADLLLHVVDACGARCRGADRRGPRGAREIGAGDVPELLVCEQDRRWPTRR